MATNRLAAFRRCTDNNDNNSNDNTVCSRLNWHFQMKVVFSRNLPVFLCQRKTVSFLIQRDTVVCSVIERMAYS